MGELGEPLGEILHWEERMSLLRLKWDAGPISEGTVDTLLLVGIIDPALGLSKLAVTVQVVLLVASPQSWQM